MIFGSLRTKSGNKAGARAAVSRLRARAVLLTAIALAACDSAPRADIDQDKAGPFPPADRPVAHIVSPRWSNEEARDRLNEAALVMDKAGIKPGMTVADIGAGEGYYTIRLGERVGAKGRVVAEDIVPAVTETLSQRVLHERKLSNIFVQLGLPANPKLPDASFDRVLMVHMYHEVEQPYEFLWRMRPSLKPDGRVVVVDANRPTQNHGTPPRLLRCEFEAVGYAMVEMHDMPSAGGYLATFRVAGPKPDPRAIKPCKLAD